MTYNLSPLAWSRISESSVSGNWCCDHYREDEKTESSPTSLLCLHIPHKTPCPCKASSGHSCYLQNMPPHIRRKNCLNPMTNPNIKFKPSCLLRRVCVLGSYVTFGLVSEAWSEVEKHRLCLEKKWVSEAWPVSPPVHPHIAFPSLTHTLTFIHFLL